MTQAEAVERLRSIHAEFAGDDELLHSKEDEILTDIVVSLGWSDFMTLYDNATHCRWCA